ncbi:MAG: hypothetical protein QXI89_00940 [Candidatus Anstonellales archaeon]
MRLNKKKVKTLNNIEEDKKIEASQYFEFLMPRNETYKIMSNKKINNVIVALFIFSLLYVLSNHVYFSSVLNSDLASNISPLQKEMMQLSLSMINEIFLFVFNILFNLIFAFIITKVITIVKTTIIRSSTIPAIRFSEVLAVCVFSFSLYYISLLSAFLPYNFILFPMFSLITSIICFYYLTKGISGLYDISMFKSFLILGLSFILSYILDSFLSIFLFLIFNY